ncbi:hypothetical protein A3D80_01880 [Candidatus Roizmanbacteria bacterium RIFCSPHIGHO2_02_FULL_40_13b]|uniref:YoaR-like putative peptidoglycan binding domain-containing protein n=1 Tax=Candidatus Roizmanbacteria bacterium RIFCSPHIGHO2_01_FULL_39_24 TaxID=1802032 RepID=A0A1F7GKX3_9BACT|nr:MAG: hypothetical protein A2799_01620 [Candidatus Roizmanbacteria bacterium RIFCSPHIGHO2_01_FULL_39_24]OGK27839.1 MAG: hypothetical protein A3D80_01880 [Candidatus Roizmanbacteria bacterium RIFCSPHIGHO2_02_FULL_40_13b]OGK49981.1 MAG: hypothetical protein A3A56_03040 [Candidatus Roizmanbacteria bacterium RIFCSPLOWO2_01_FULL_40_32]OGK55986.1 MAG: hypothetical protein A3H83_02835 [Candidatus Roizmanbacteria bacterium RIFCSPLOWO2_02_FULL_39_8]
MHHTKLALSFFARSLFFSMVFFLFFIGTLTFYLNRKQADLRGKIYPNVYVDNIHFGYKNRSEVEKYLKNKNKTLSHVFLRLTYDTKEATFSAQALHLTLDTKTPTDQAYLIGRVGNNASQIAQQIRSLFTIGRFDFYSSIDYDKTIINNYLDTLDASYSRPPENALFTVENNRVSAFKIEKNGLQIQKKETIAKIEKQLMGLSTGTNKKGGIVVPVSYEISKPTVTLSSINDLGIVEKIGEGTSNYAGSIPGRIHNVILGTSRINGVIVPKDSVFSFNNTIGDISAATGYQPAYIIKEGKTILGDGGGICQVSTTLFRAIMNTGLPVLERQAHAYRVHYYENDKRPGFDATVFGPTVDLKFKNDTPAAILIQTKVDQVNQIVTFEMYGKSDGRLVTLSDSKIWDVQAAPDPKYQDDPTLPKGTQKQVDWAAPGTKALFHYKVERGGQILQDTDFYSNYRPWQAIFLVGTGG